MLADLYTPVGIYLRLRDRFRDTILLESADFHTAEHSFSFICINAIAGIEIKAAGQVEYKLPGQNPERESLRPNTSIINVLNGFLDRFEYEKPDGPSYALGLYGYTSFDAI